MSPIQLHFQTLERNCKDKDLTLSEVCNAFGPDGHYVLSLFMILPFLQPIPMIGLSTPFGFLIAAISILAYLKKPPYIPRRWKEKKISSVVILKITGGFEKIFNKISFFVHPRWPLFVSNPLRLFNTILIVINCILLALPLPIPFTNTLPAYAIFTMALAFLEEDGLLIFISYVISAATAVYFILIAKSLESALRALF
jgi:hypothetical protein